MKLRKPAAMVAMDAEDDGGLTGDEYMHARSGCRGQVSLVGLAGKR